MKYCEFCQELKPRNTENFYKSKDSPDGFYSKCKRCKNGKIKKPKQTHKQCSICNELKLICEFYEKKKQCNKCRNKLSYERSDKELAKLRHEEWRKENLDKHNENGKSWKRKNKDKHREYNKIWAKLNKDKVRAKDARRRAAKLNATPLWVNQEEINKIYTKCQTIEDETGVKHEVDHIIPLQGKNVCGLHVHYNLRVVTRYENRSKGNKTE